MLDDETAAHYALDPLACPHCRGQGKSCCDGTGRVSVSTTHKVTEIGGGTMPPPVRYSCFDCGADAVAGVACACGSRTQTVD